MATLVQSLLVEEWNTLGKALIANRPYPILTHMASAMTGFAADDYPTDASQIDVPNILEQWLNREKPNGGGNVAQIVDPRHAVFAILDRDRATEVRSSLTYAPPCLVPVNVVNMLALPEAPSKFRFCYDAMLVGISANVGQ
jgi:hypothetical protein